MGTLIGMGAGFGSSQLLAGTECLIVYRSERFKEALPEGVR
jgi:hypothetical protein